MNLPRRRRSRPKGRARLDTDRNITEELRAVPPAPWHGRTVPLAELRGQPHYTPPWRPDGERFADPRTWRHPIDTGVMSAPVPPRTHQAAYGEWTGTMTINDTRARRLHGRPVPPPRILPRPQSRLPRRPGMGYRIDEAEQVMKRGEEPRRSVIADTLAEAVRTCWAPRPGSPGGTTAGRRTALVLPEPANR